jgi:hypothetical protein
MVIPEFPLFGAIDLSCKDVISGLLSRYPLEASEYTFTNIFAFRKEYDLGISLLQKSLIIHKSIRPASVFCPIGKFRSQGVLEKVFNYMKDRDTEPLLERVPEGFVEAFLRENDNLIIKEDRDNFDYVYDVRELVELKGNRFHDKKNKVNYFRSHYEYEYLKLTPDLISECLEFEDYWCQMRECGKSPGLKRERCAILEMLNNFRALGICGGVIKIWGKIAALTLGETLLPDTFVIHVEKANPEFPGLYQTINQEFLKHEAGNFRFVNREQDLGIAGLRKAKVTYNPVRFVNKYTVRKK